MMFKFLFSTQKFKLKSIFRKKKVTKVSTHLKLLKNKALEHVSLKTVGKWLNAIPK